MAALWPLRPRMASAVPAARRGVCDPCSMVRPQTDCVERVDKHKEAWPRVLWLCVAVYGVSSKYGGLLLSPLTYLLQSSPLLYALRAVSATVSGHR